MSDDEIKLREISDMREAIARLQEWRTLYEKMMDERRDSTEKALVLQAEKDKEHMDRLNNSTARIEKIDLSKVDASYFKREIEIMGEKIGNLRDYKSWSSGRQSIISIISAAFVSLVIGLILQHFTK